MKEILSILNPVHLLFEDEFDTLATLSGKPVGLIRKNWEQLTRGKWVDASDNGWYQLEKSQLKKENRTVFQPALLTKEMFVNSVEKPFIPGTTETGRLLIYERKYNEYQSAQEKVILEGFEMVATCVVCGIVPDAIYFQNDLLWSIGQMGIKNPTVFDFIIEIDRYNRTAKEKIVINYTENFAKLLIQTN